MEQAITNTQRFSLTRYVIENDEYDIISAQVSFCGTYLACLTKKRAVLIFDLQKSTRFELPIQSPAHCIQFSPFAPELSIAVENSSILRFDLRYPRMQMNPLRHINATALTHVGQGDASLLICGSANGKISLFWTNSEPFPTKVFEHRVIDSCITTLAVSGETIYGACDEGIVFSMPLTQCPQSGSVQRIDDQPWDCYAISSNNYASMVASGGYGSYVRLYAANSTQPCFIPTGFTYIRQIEFLAHNQLAVVGNGGVEVWNFYEMTCESRLTFPNMNPLCARLVGRNLIVAWH